MLVDLYTCPDNPHVPHSHDPNRLDYCRTCGHDLRQLATAQQRRLEALHWESRQASTPGERCTEYYKFQRPR
jgi:hypothetical protein